MRGRALHWRFSLSRAFQKKTTTTTNKKKQCSRWCMSPCWATYMASFILSPLSASRSSSERWNWRETRSRYRSAISSTLRFTRMYCWESRGGPSLSRDQSVCTWNTKCSCEQSKHNRTDIHHQINYMDCRCWFCFQIAFWAGQIAGNSSCHRGLHS